MLHEEIDKWQQLSVEGRALTGTPSGFTDLDTITGGFQPGNLIVVAARPSMGKSALVTNIAENVALHRERPRPVALFSLEMAEAELAQRFIASQASIKGDDLRKGRLRDESKWKRVLRVAGDYDVAPLYVDDSSDIGILDIRAKARRLHQQTMAEHGGLGLIIVDYLQLMRADTRIENRVQQVGEMSRGLKILGARARRPGHRAVPAQPRRRVAHGQAADAVGPARVRDRATRRSSSPTGGACRSASSSAREPEVLAVDADDRAVAARSDRVWRVGRRPVHALRLASGRTLRATADHRVRTGAGWQHVGELRAGDRVALARRLPEPAATGALARRPRRAARPPRRRRQLPAGPAAALHDRVRGEQRGGSRCGRAWLRRAGPPPPARPGPAPARPLRRRPPRGARAESTPGCASWASSASARARSASRPRCSRLGDEQIGLLLRHLWATDGSIFAYSTSSPGLAGDVAALLLRLGVVARTQVSRSVHGVVHHVLVSGATARRAFLERVGRVRPPR